MKLLNKLKSLFVKTPKNELKVWAVIEGPIEQPDGVYANIVKASWNGKSITTEFYFSTFDDAYFFKTTVEKGEDVTIELPEGAEVQTIDYKVN